MFSRIFKLNSRAVLPRAVFSTRLYSTQTIPSWVDSLSDPLNVEPTGLRSHFVEKYNRKKNEHEFRVRADDRTDVTSFAKNIRLDLKMDDEDHAAHFGIVEPREVFINNELNLKRVDVYGFDYDYTIANYTETLSKTIYQILRDILIDSMRYPSSLRALEFDPKFAIRGLHYDFQYGYLMKIDSYNNIQMSTVHVGREPLDNINLVTDIHNGVHVAPNYMAENMHQLNDLFSVPETCLLSDVLQYFKDTSRPFHPRYLYDDIRSAARILHSGNSREGGIGGLLHSRVMENVSDYLSPSPHLVSYLERLRAHGKRTFLLTNSSFPFIDRGLTYITERKDWIELFDLVVVLANKPSFYAKDNKRPFRRIEQDGRGEWGVVDQFKRGEVYQGGNLATFCELTGWVGQKVMYIGDHVFSDLIDATVQQGWRTGAIIRELSSEIAIRNTPTYRHSLVWMLRLEKLIKQAQAAKRENTQRDEFLDLDPILEQWREERRQIRLELKTVFNQQFGSVFRTHHNPTYFANKIRKFADVYTSDLENMSNYPLDYIFYPERAYLPHERIVETLIDSGRINTLA